MNAVHNVLSWLKANPIPVICVIITLASAVTFYTPTYTSSEKLRGQLNARGGQISSIQQLQMTPGVIPASEPDAPPINVTMTVNKAAIDKLTQVFKDLDNEYTGIFDQAADYNQQGHEVMLADIFPNVKDASKPFRARDAYKVALEDLYSTLNAKPVPDEQYKTNALAEVEQSFLLSRNLTSLNPADKEIVVQRQTDKLLEVYNFHAGGISVYADTTELDELQGKWQPGPLQVMEWAKNGPKPLQFDMWEGQMQLWIQQDIVEAIRIANHILPVNDSTDNSTLLNEPIKRILGIHVATGYVGLDTLDNPMSTVGAFGGASSAAKPFSLEARSGAELATADTVQQALDSRITDNFLLSGTGRQTNPIYDVRHGYLSIIVDSAKIPDVLNAIGHVNYMTIIGIKTTDVDEYEHLREGYYYGQVDCVQLDIHIESIWLRAWTAGDLQVDEENEAAFNPGIMPDDVRYHLNLPPRSENYITERAERIADLRAASN